MDLERLVEQITEIAARTREALETATVQLRAWPDDQPLDWRPVAFVIPTPYNGLEVHAFAATVKQAAITTAVILELACRS